MNAKDARAKLEALVDGCSAIVSCLGNRQPFEARWIAKGTALALEAARAKQVPRFVALNSFGIGNDWLPRQGFIPKLWSCLLATHLRGARRDLESQERLLTASDLDFLVFKPTGLTPEAPPTGHWKLVTGPGDRQTVSYILFLSQTSCFSCCNRP